MYWVMSILVLSMCVYGNALISSFDIQTLVQKERKLIEIYMSFLADDNNTGNDSVIMVLKGKLQSIEKQNIKSNNVYLVVGHPIGYFHLLNRLVNRWSGIFNQTFCPNCMDLKQAKELRQRVRNLLYDLYGWPTDTDVTESAIALLRLWKTYDLNLEHLFNGQILDWKTEPLALDDIVLIIKYAFQQEMTFHGVEWTCHLLKHLNQRKLTSIDNKTVIMKVKGILDKHNIQYKSADDSKSIQIIQNSYKGIDISGENNRNSAEYDHTYSYVEDDIQNKYETLCKNSINRMQNINSNNKCYLGKTKNPLYRSKEEIVHTQPKISLFHDVISETEIEALKHIALGTRFSDSEVHKTEEMSMIHARVSKTAWVEDTGHNVTQYLSRRISTITGLDTSWKYPITNAEQMQIVSYGVGGLLTPHTDFLGWNYLIQHEGPPLFGSGDRLATWMFYLNDVIKGGATAFPLLNIAVLPKKGSALFWFNLKSDGEYDTKTLHGGCPVLLGHKWIANKWIREFGQIFTKPCDVNNYVTP